MNESFFLVLGSAFAIGAVHTFSGPDHYLPFIALARSRGWNRTQTMGITLVCGLAHILSALGIGLVAAYASSVLERLGVIESIRGDVAAWALVAFGGVYAIWGLKHSSQDHSHKKQGLAFWTLFLIFLFGPCEPLIPLVLYPAAQSSPFHILMTVIAFSLSTLVVMLFMVSFSHILLEQLGKKPWFQFLHRYSHVLAGTIIAFCGMGILFLGL
ncbi:MAG: hypothetical protein MI717_06845 [Spirochaetales bacterium]|nr:hypothetical protein [Spirochaetales bacterium]